MVSRQGFTFRSGNSSSETLAPLRWTLEDATHEAGWTACSTNETRRPPQFQLGIDMVKAEERHDKSL